MKDKAPDKVSGAVRSKSSSEMIENLKDELIRCEDSFEACFVARDLAEILFQTGDTIKSVHYFFLAGEGFVREGEIFQAMAILCRLRDIPQAKKESQDLKVLISDSFAVSRKKRKDSDTDVPIPTPFREFSASVTFDEKAEPTVPRNQLIEKTDAKFALFSSLRPAELEALLDIAVRKNLRPDDVLYKEGDGSASFYVVVSGSLMVSNRLGYCRSLDVGEFVGDITYFAGLRRGATVAAQEGVEVLEFSGRALSEIFKRLPNLQERIWYFYERRLFLNIALRSELFKNMNLEEIGVVYDYLLAAEVSEKKIIKKADSPAESFFFLVQGQCELTSPQKDREVLNEGRFIQLEEFLKKKKTPDQVVSKTSAYILECNRDSFEKLCGLLPQLAKNAAELASTKSVTAFAGVPVID